MGDQQGRPCLRQGLQDDTAPGHDGSAACRQPSWSHSSIISLRGNQPTPVVAPITATAGATNPEGCIEDDPAMSGRNLDRPEGKPRHNGRSYQGQNQPPTICLSQGQQLTFTLKRYPPNKTQTFAASLSFMMGSSGGSFQTCDRQIPSVPDPQHHKPTKPLHWPCWHTHSV